MSIIFMIWVWFFSNLFIEPSSILLLTASIVATLITVDLWKFSNRIYKERK